MSVRSTQSGGTYLFVLPWKLDAVGGVNQVVRDLYEGIQSLSSLRPRVLQLCWEARVPVDATDPSGRAITNCRIRTMGASRAFALELLRYALFAPYELRKVRDLVRRYDVRVVNTHYVGSTELTWALAKTLGLFRGKLLFSLHGLDIRTLGKLRGARRTLWGWVLRRADAIVACSIGLAEEVIRDFGLPPAIVVTVHNGIDAARLHRTAPGDTARDDAAAPVLLNLGTFEHKKGHDVLVRAFAKVTERYPAARLTIMGRDSSARRGTRRLVEELRLGDRVSLHTDVAHEAALRALRNADLFVLSSRNEAFAVSLLEAAALEKPVVATDVCGVPELIRDGETGVLVPSDDADALATGILRMLDDRTLGIRCAARLKELVATAFTLEQTTAGYLTLIGYGQR